MTRPTPYFAHIAKDGRKQTVADHLHHTASLAEGFAAPFGAGEQAKLAGLAHDLGKYSEAFQKRLTGGPKVDHATFGASVCFQQGQPCAAFAVAGHHGGLPDGGSQIDTPESSTFWGRMNRARLGRLENADAGLKEVTLPAPAHLPAKKESDEEMFFTRMLYSCLVDADYLDTEAFMSDTAREERALSIDQLWEKLEHYISDWFPPKSELNRRRCAILQHCIQEGAQRSPGLFTLTVPTGGGKTVSSLAFALAHAKTQGLRRVIYVIPYTSIIEQTAQVFRDILGAENVLEHHSNILYDTEDETDPQTIRFAQATENWDMPVIVTTAVQFFESLFANRSSQCRKLHNIAQSVVIFDEAQMLPIPYLRPCIYAVCQLIKYYGVSAVMCTATQPALGHLFDEFLPTHPPVELCPPAVCEWDAFRRVTIQRAGRLSWDDLAQQLQRHQQVLCIVNTRKSAQEMFDRMDKEGLFHLSTLMYPKHRRMLLDEIRRRLPLGLPCRVISTSLIEAGVDVDFPAVYREESGLDSILQAAGRCNREGGHSPEESIVTIFQGEGKAPPLFLTAIGAGRQIMAQHKDLTSPEAIHDYFYQLLDLKGAAAQDTHGIMRTIQKELWPFRTVAERFHLIDSPTHTVYIPDKEGKELVAQLCKGEHNRALMRKLGQYSVSIYEQHFVALERAGDLTILEDGSAILENMALYSSKTGLSLTADSGKAIFI